MHNVTAHHDAFRADERGVFGVHWGVLLGMGVLLFIVGVIALGASTASTLVTVLFIGGALLVDGALDVAVGLTSLRWRGAMSHIGIGILVAIGGLMLLWMPSVGAAAITLLLALLFLGGGGARLIHAVVERFPMWGWAAAGALVTMLLGVLVLAGWPGSSMWFLGILVGVELLTRGSIWIALAMALRSASHRVGPGGTVEAT